MSSFPHTFSLSGCSQETSPLQDASASKSTPRKAPVPQRTRATAKGAKGKKPLRNLADETLAETEKVRSLPQPFFAARAQSGRGEQHRKEKAREKWKEIDEFQLETVYTL